MSSASARGRTVYASLTDSEKAAVREDIFRDLTSLEAILEGYLARSTQSRDLLNELEAFVIANAADFTAPQRNELQTARDRLQQKVADHANSWSRISGAVVGP